MRLAHIAAPATEATRLADEVARMFASPALDCQSVRSYYWSAAYAAAQEVGV